MTIKQISQGGVAQQYAVYDTLGNELFKGLYVDAQAYYDANKQKVLEDAYTVDGNLVNAKRVQVPAIKLNEGWKDLKATFNAARTTPQASPTWEIFKGGIYAYSFAPNAVEELIMTPYHYDHDQALATLSHIHVHWATSEGSAGTVRWGFEITHAKGHGQEAFKEPFTVYVEQEVVAGQEEFHYIAEDLIGILGAGEIEPDTLVLIRAFRDGTHPNDTYPAKAWGFTADFHYRSDHETTIGKRPDFNQPDI